MRTANDFNNILATLPADWPVALRVRRGDQAIAAATRLERLPLNVPLVYIVDLEHNHRELMDILDRSAARIPTRVSKPWSRLAFRGRVRSGASGVEPEFELTVVTPRSDDAPAAEPVLPDDDRPAPDELLDARVYAEWQQLALPLLTRPPADLAWELLAGDEVNGRIVNVIERRLDSGERVRWKFDWQTDELLQVTFISAPADQSRTDRPRAEPSPPVVWLPSSPDRFDDLVWPRKWIRLDAGGESIEFEIASIALVPPLPAAPSADDSPAEGDE